MAETTKKVPRRIAQTVLNSLKGGVVPRIGLPYIAVGRKNEVEALLHDVDIISEGGASFRFIVGRYGSGKSFLIQTIRNYVMDKGFIVADADLSPERRLQGSRGQGLATYRELISNLSTKYKPEGNALTLILDRWISTVQSEALQETGAALGDPVLTQAVDQKIYAVTSSVSELVHGFEFATLLSRYYHAYVEGDDETKMKVVRWFRGEYALKREAKSELGVNIIISDDDWYDYIKLFAIFFRKAGYAGMMIMIDELVNIYKIPHSVTRQYNYEKMLTMYNDTLQGKAQYLGIIMGSTPQAIEDKRRGVYSYEALRSRLAEGKFSRPGARDLLAPVIRLDPLNPEEMLVLCEKLADMHAGLYGYERHISEQELGGFIQLEYSRIGADQNITPREVIRDFIELLDIVYQNPSVKINELLSSGEFQYAQSQAIPGDSAGVAGAEPGAAGSVDAQFAEFTL
ncbi:ATP-binding protein [Alloscardovia macacae]|uniref:Biotin carboxylase n=1 Tax=Alloscardovia macacae TaxID=1160091 RepID=A0A261F6T2_9BIFI|nr:ATP-binding protein [Alloscardovia macacae]OZG54850.1 biotin carboxylase [Alloscardovia macacae]